MGIGATSNGGITLSAPRSRQEPTGGRKGHFGILCPSPSRRGLLSPPAR